MPTEGHEGHVQPLQSSEHLWTQQQVAEEVAQLEATTTTTSPTMPLRNTCSCGMSLVENHCLDPIIKHFMPPASHSGSSFLLVQSII